MTYQSADCPDFATAERISLSPTATIWSGVTRLLKGIKNRWAMHAQRRTDRAAFRHMLTLDDEILDDIGVTRANAEWASQLPIHLSASRELEELTRDKQRNRLSRARPRRRQ